MILVRKSEEREHVEYLGLDGRIIFEIIIISIQPEGRFLAGTRAQSGDRYGSGTLHSRQFLRVRLPLLSPAFRRSHFRL